MRVSRIAVSGQERSWATGAGVPMRGKRRLRRVGSGQTSSLGLPIERASCTIPGHWRPQSQPYGIIMAKDILWYSESGTKPNTIVRFDPKTEKFQTWTIPGGGDIVRNM
jgi:hypothetical protein